MRLIAAALTLITAFLINVVAAIPLEERVAQTTSSLSTSSSTVLSTPLQVSSTTGPLPSRRSSERSSPHTSTSSSLTLSVDQSATPAPTEEARILASSSSSPTAVFCRDFVKQCYRTALRGHTGEVTVSHSCERNGRGGEGSSSFTFSCARGTQDLTAQVLRTMGWDFHIPLTTTSDEGVRILTEIVEDIATVFDVLTTKVTTSTKSIVTSTRTNRVGKVTTQTLISTTTTLTTAIPYTTSLTFTATQTDFAVTTAPSTTTTQTQVFVGTYEVPVFRATVSAEELQRRAPSTFCLAYKIACENECTRVSSRRKTWICERDPPRYTLACICGNGIVETQHALEAIAEDRRYVSVTIWGTTSTSYLTSSTTITIPTETLTTRLVTKTSLVDITTTATSTSTTFGATTHFTGLSSLAQTERTTLTSTTTQATTTTPRIVTTTQIVLAATGYARGFNKDTGGQLGTLGGQVDIAFALFYPPDSGQGVELMAIRDTPTGLFKMTVMGMPEVALVTHGPSQQIFKLNGTSYARASLQHTSQCGAAGSAPGPIPNADQDCEAFVVSPLALDLGAPGASVDTINLRPFYINPLGAVPANHSGSWAVFTGTDGGMLHVADPATWSRVLPTVMLAWVDLRFPFPS